MAWGWSISQRRVTISQGHLNVHRSINIQSDWSYCDWRQARIQCNICAHYHRSKHQLADKFRLRISASRPAFPSALQDVDAKKQRLQRATVLRSRISSVVPNLTSATWEKQSLVSRSHPNEINGTMRSVTRQLQPKSSHTAATRAIVENYRERRKDESHRKGEQERREREEVEMYR